MSFKHDGMFKDVREPWYGILSMKVKSRPGDQISDDNSDIHTETEEWCAKTVQSYKTDHIGRTRIVADQKQRLAGKEAGGRTMLSRYFSPERIAGEKTNQNR